MTTPFGQRLLDLLDLLLDPVDDDAAVLAGEQIDDRRDRLAPAVAGRGPLADHRREADGAHVADVDRRAARGRLEDDLLQVLEAADQAHAADHPQLAVARWM